MYQQFHNELCHINFVYQQFHNELCHVDTKSTLEARHETHWPFVRSRETEHLNIHDLPNIYQLLMTNIHIIRSSRQAIKTAGLFLDIIRWNSIN